MSSRGLPTAAANRILATVRRSIKSLPDWLRQVSSEFHFGRNRHFATGVLHRPENPHVRVYLDRVHAGWQPLPVAFRILQEGAWN